MKSDTTANRLRIIMNQKGLRQIDIINLSKPFCKKLGVKLSKSDLSQYLSGRIEPRQEKLTVLSLALGVSETWLMGYDVPVERDASSSKNSDPYKSQLDACYNQLNSSGKIEACRRVSELTEIPRYTDAGSNSKGSIDTAEILRLLESSDDDEVMTVVAKGGNGVKQIKVSKEATETALRMLEALDEGNMHDK